MVLLWLFACPAPDSAVGGGAEGKMPIGTTAQFTCSGAGSSWDESTPAFAETTERWGLSGLTGLNMVSLDLDGDGWTDLITSESPHETRDDFAAGTYYHHVLMNRDDGTGARIFVDESEESGILVGIDGLPGTSASLYVAADVDGDGDLDLFAGRYHDEGNEDATGERNGIYLNDGAGHFTRVAQSGLEGDSAWATAAASFTEVDGDGIPDLWLVGWYKEYGVSLDSSPPKLYRGNGDGTFVDVTDGTAMDLKATRSYDQWNDRAHRRPGYGGTACDVDADGVPELIQSSYARTWNLLFSKGSGSWVEEGEDRGIDADSDLTYTDNLMYACYCADHSCDPAPTISCGGAFPDNYWTPTYDDQPGRLAGNTFTTVCGDIDNDGDLDLYHTEIHPKWAGESGDGSQLLLNDGTGFFTRKSGDENGLARKQSKVSDWNEGDMQAAFFDFDLDGWKDILLMDSDYPDTHLYTWHNEGDGTFTEVSDAAGLNQPWPHGLTVADYDRDGDLDVVTGSSMARSGTPWTTYELHLYENQLGGSSIRLAGIPLGARVDVESGGITQTFEVSGGYGLWGMMDDTALTVGLPGDCRVEDVAITPLFGATTHSGPLSGS